MEYLRHLTRTISFWSAVSGGVAYATGRRSLAVFLWRIVGAGGVGAVFGASSTRYGVEIEPAVFIRRLRGDEFRHKTIIAILWHAVFWALAEILDKKERRR